MENHQKMSLTHVVSSTTTATATYKRLVCACHIQSWKTTSGLSWVIRLCLVESVMVLTPHSGKMMTRLNMMVGLFLTKLPNSYPGKSTQAALAPLVGVISSLPCVSRRLGTVLLHYLECQ